MIAYAITNPSTLDFTNLEKVLNPLSSKATMVVYRDKTTMTYEENAKLFLAQAQGFERVLLHTDYVLAAKLHADGIHLKSTQFDDVKKAKALGLFVVISTHTLKEVREAEILGADMVTFSPVFNTPNKGLAVGLKVLEDVVASVNIPVIALGGILTQEQISSCVDVGAEGFASIRYFELNLFNSL